MLGASVLCARASPSEPPELAHETWDGAQSTPRAPATQVVSISVRRESGSRWRWAQVAESGRGHFGLSRWNACARIWTVGARREARLTVVRRVGDVWDVLWANWGAGQVAPACCNILQGCRGSSRGCKGRVSHFMAWVFAPLAGSCGRTLVHMNQWCCDGHGCSWRQPRALKKNFGLLDLSSHSRGMNSEKYVDSP